MNRRRTRVFASVFQHTYPLWCSQTPLVLHFLRSERHKSPPKCILQTRSGQLAGSYVPRRSDHVGYGTHRPEVMSRGGLRERSLRARSALASITSVRAAKFSPVRGHKPTYATAHLRFSYIPLLLHYLRSAAPEENFSLPRAVPFDLAAQYFRDSGAEDNEDLETFLGHRR